MTREEIKDELYRMLSDVLNGNGPIRNNTQRGRYREAVKLATEALQQQPCDKCVYSTSEGCQYDEITETIPPFEISDDAISKQAVLSKIKEVCFSEEWASFRVDNGSNGQRDFLINYIEQLQPVNQQEPCSNCCNGNQIEKAKLCQKSYLAGMEHKQEQCADAISRRAVLDKLNRLIEVERLQGTDEMGYGRERVSAYESMIFEIESEYLYPSVSSSENPNKCEDAISRQMVLDATVNKNSIWNNITNAKGENLEEIILQLPSVNQLNKWIGAEVLDKIRADIAELWKNEPCPIEYGCLNEILQIIDKYMAEGSGEE